MQINHKHLAGQMMKQQLHSLLASFFSLIASSAGTAWPEQGISFFLCRVSRLGHLYVPMGAGSAHRSMLVVMLKGSTT